MEVVMRSLLIGKHLKLDALETCDLDIMHHWFNNVEFLRHYDMIPAIPKSQKDMIKLLEYYDSSDEKLIFAVRILDSDKLIGIVGFDEIQWTNGVATTFIGIGDMEARGKGYGKEALDLLLDFGFNELNFHRIQLNVISYNDAAIALYETLGFVKEGIYRELIYRDGKRYDL
ncbi:MAG: GNAT family N-acetyltransferase, partial [Clostridiales bacterium]|nr:GNAT family N-acetyltransferase [Clostridiales bacterium]